MSSEMRKAFNAMTQNRRVSLEERLMFEAGWNAAFDWFKNEVKEAGYAGGTKKFANATRSVVFVSGPSRYRRDLGNKEGT